jgi:hypothetical protein
MEERKPFLSEMNLYDVTCISFLIDVSFNLQLTSPVASLGYDEALHVSSISESKVTEWENSIWKFMMFF